MTNPFQPTFLTNAPDEGRTVGYALRRYLTHIAEATHAAPDMDIATAYFNPGGFKALEEPLGKMGNVRLLLGAEPDESPRPKPLAGRSTRRRRASAAMKDAAAKHERELQVDRDLLGFSIEADANARALVEWLNGAGAEENATRVEVRRLTTEFLHGKAYLLSGPAGSAVFAGSSNFTYAGLHLNRELNLGQYDPHTVAEVREWFDDMWSKAEPYDLASLYSNRWEPHSPQLIFLRMLWERYIDELEQEKSERATSELRLTQFQSDGVWRARRILNRLHGVIIADEVGLGKTFLAGELIHDAMIKRRQKVLIVCPATLRDSTWKPFLRDKNLQTVVMSFEELVNEIETPGQTGSKLESFDNYAMVVIDEAHALRNSSSKRAEAMRKLTSGKVPKDLIMLTATPVNNSLRDVQNLLSYFITNDAQFAEAGVPSLSEYFKRAMDMHPDDLSPEHLFDVLDQVAVRRTRQFVRNHYANDTVRINGRDMRISFPEPRVKRVDYDLDSVSPGFFDKVATALGANLEEEADAVGVIDDLSGDVLTMARYVPSRFRLGGDADSEQFERQNAGLLRSALLKRFESSAYAYEQTLLALIASHKSFLKALDRGFVLTGEALREWGMSGTDDVLEFLAERDSDDRNSMDASDYRVDELRRYCEQDLRLLEEMLQQANALSLLPDPKIDQLVEELVTIAEESESGRTDDERRDRRKVLVFTYFADTAEHVSKQLTARLVEDDRLQAYRGRMITVTGDDSDRKAELIANFAPKTAGSPEDEDLYDIVIATDVLAEGVNLQQAGQIINYDLPWNPMRLVQRHGRIDRIGSQHKTVHMRCFFPDQHLDSMLGLEERLQLKLKTAAASFGVGAGVLPGAEGREASFTETRTQIDGLRHGDTTLFGTGGAAAQSGEDYRRTLEKKIDDPEMKSAIEALPWGSGSGFTVDGGDAGVVFCVRIADHGKPWFRFVPLHPTTLKPRTMVDTVTGQLTQVVVDDALASLSAADPRGEPRVLDDDMMASVYEAWDATRTDVVAKWNFQADPVNVMPDVPKSMRDAADFVAAHGGKLGAKQMSICDRLRAPHSSRVQKETREILRSGDTPAAIAEQLAAMADRHNLVATPPVTPQPTITVEDVHLICWQAFRPRESVEMDGPSHGL